MNRIHVFYQYIQTDVTDPDSAEPALILGRKTFGKGCAFVICLSGLYKYTDDHYLMQQSRIAANVLGLNGDSKYDVMPIADLIINGIDRLVKMPPEELDMMELRAKKSRGNAVITLNGVEHHV